MDTLEAATMSEKITLSGEPLRRVGVDLTPPDPARLILALRQIGYSFEQAVSDLVDNSISAGSSAVLIRFVCDGERIRSVAIADNGTGMDGAALYEAMRFGSEMETRDAASLGKYGMGLKLASLSHARCVTVLTRKNGESIGRRWTIEQIQKGWECERLAEAAVSRELDAAWSELSLRKQGTVVIWDSVDKLVIGARGLREVLRGLQKRLQLHLGLCFHRFLENGTLRIFLDQQTAGQHERHVRVEIRSLNPFDYDRSGDPDYPKVFCVELPGVGSLEAEAHIWPPNADSAAYKLGNRAAARQGFYFYRNGRLIQAGGWNGLVRHETEPHSSLARVRIDLPPQLDDVFGLNVQKSAVIVPAAFESAVTRARSEDEGDFESYRARAQQIYRRRDARANKYLPLIPTNGLPKALTNLAAELLSKKGQAGRAISFRWMKLDEETMFALDRERGVINLNKRLRSAMLRDSTPRRVDLATLKLMLFFAVEGDLLADRTSGLRKERLDQMNQLLSAAITLDS